MMGPAAGIASIVLTAVAGVAQAHTQRQAGRQARRVARYNAEVQRRRSQDAIARGEYRESVRRMQISRLLGAQRAAIGASGVDVGLGSAAALQESTAYLGELDALMERNNAFREAWGYESAAVADLYSGEQAHSASQLQSVGTVIGTAAQATGMARNL